MKKIVTILIVLSSLISCNNKKSNTNVVEQKMSMLIEALRNNNVEMLSKELPSVNDLEKVFLASKMDEKERYEFTHPYYIQTEKVSYLKGIKRDFREGENAWKTIKPHTSIFRVYDYKGLDIYSGKLLFSTSNDNLYKLNLSFVIIDNQVFIINTDNDIDKYGTKSQFKASLVQIKNKIKKYSEENDGKEVAMIIFE